MVGAIFWENPNIKFFLMWTTLKINGKSKMEKENGDIFKGTLDIEFELDWPIGLGATQNFFKNLSLWDFSGKSRNGILLGFECSINPQNLI